MISPQPINLVKYLGSKMHNTPTRLKRLFYLSFEDALWGLCAKKGVKKGSIILVPYFFCGDVEENIKKRGYKIQYYYVNPSLLVDTLDFKNKIKKYNPSIIIVLHIAGITSNLFRNTNWISTLSSNTILIEDCVHKIINPKNIKILKANHFLINSLRKVVPLQGSSVYSLKENLNFNTPPWYQSFFYSVQVNILWLCMTVAAGFGLSRLAEKLMITGYDLIGDSHLPTKGFFIFNYLEQFLDYDKTTKLKVSQAKLYSKELKSLAENFPFFRQSDYGHLRAWPIILSLSTANKVLTNIRAQGLIIRFELNDSKWSKKQKMIYLPMGAHITTNDQIKICKIVLNSVN